MVDKVELGYRLFPDSKNYWFSPVSTIVPNALYSSFIHLPPAVRNLSR